MKWNVICNAEDRFSCLELFLRAKNNNVLELRTLMLCLVQLSKWRESKATDAESFFLSERKLLNAILRVKLKYMKCFFLMKWNVICNVEDRFWCVRAFLQSSHVRASMQNHWFRASKNTNDVFSATKQWRECKARMLKSFFLSERKLLNAI